MFMFLQPESVCWLKIIYWICREHSIETKIKKQKKEKQPTMFV